MVIVKHAKTRACVKNAIVVATTNMILKMENALENMECIKEKIYYGILDNQERGNERTVGIS